MRLTLPAICTLFAAGLLAGCAERAEPGAGSDAPDTAVSVDAGTSAPPGPAADQPADCNAARARAFVGETADEATRARLREAVAPIAAIRWVGPGDATTEDFSPTRLNVMLDAGTRIVSVHCG